VAEITQNIRTRDHRPTTFIMGNLIGRH